MSYCVVIMKIILILALLLPIIECFNPDLSNEAYTYEKKEMLPHLFDRVPLPAPGIIPMLNRKIFRGKRVSIREHPYVASIRRNVAHYSVGTIVTKNVLVTVAHPLINVSIAELSVVVGENYADRGSMLLTVILMIVHEDFNPSTLGNDIALLRIFEDITYKGSAKSIPLIRVSRSLEGRKAFVTGWGRCDRTGRELCLPRSTRYTEGERFDPMLRTVIFRIKEDNSYCNTYKRNQMRLGPGMLCLGTAREEDPVVRCLAVPGAPLVVGAHLTGILSWGFGCGHNLDLPLIYTSTQYYQPWLLHNIMKLRSISKVYLLKLFQAKRAYILEQWLMLTRILPPKLYTEVDKHMEPLRVDRELAKLSGTVLDIRDFLYNGVHHKYKLKLYKKLRDSYAVTTVKNDVKQEEIRTWFKKRNDTLRPFFLKDFNETDANMDDDSLTDSGDILDGDDDNEEYGVY